MVSEIHHLPACSAQLHECCVSAVDAGVPHLKCWFRAGIGIKVRVRSRYSMLPVPNSIEVDGSEGAFARLEDVPVRTGKF